MLQIHPITLLIVRHYHNIFLFLFFLNYYSYNLLTNIFIDSVFELIENMLQIMREIFRNIRTVQQKRGSEHPQTKMNFILPK